MPLHLVKLSVGAATIADLEARVAARLVAGAAGNAPGVAIVTRRVPTRAAEVLDGGSLFWVVRGHVSARQRVRAVEPFTDGDGVGRCRLLLDPAVVPVLPRPYRPFQGWRYLPEGERPADLEAMPGALDMPERLRQDLRELCLL